MKKQYNESYFDRKNWILENFDKLNLTTDETLLILLVDLCKINKVYVTQEYLLKKLKKTLLSLLSALMVVTLVNVPVNVEASTAEVDSLAGELVTYYRDYQEKAETDKMVSLTSLQRDSGVCTPTSPQRILKVIILINKPPV